MGRCAAGLTQFLEAYGLFQIFGGLARQCVRIGETTVVMRLHRQVQKSIGLATQLVRWHGAIQAISASFVGWLFDTKRKKLFL